MSIRGEILRQAADGVPEAYIAFTGDYVCGDESYYATRPDSDGHILQPSVTAQAFEYPAHVRVFIKAHTPRRVALDLLKKIRQAIKAGALDELSKAATDDAAQCAVERNELRDRGQNHIPF